MERKIGSTFTDNGVELKVEKSQMPDLCRGCYYITIDCDADEVQNLVGGCCSEDRADEIDVIFTEVTKTAVV